LSERFYQKLKKCGTKSSHLNGGEDIFELCAGFPPSNLHFFGSKLKGQLSFDAEFSFCKNNRHQMGLTFQKGLVCKATERSALDFWNCLHSLLMILTVVLPIVQVGLRVRDSYSMISKQPHKNCRKLNKSLSGLQYAAFLMTFPAAVYAQSIIVDNGYVRANPDISQYSFSSCYAGDPPGYGHCSPQIESPQVSCC
jgi:hypothetical protein